MFLSLAWVVRWTVYVRFDDLFGLFRVLLSSIGCCVCVVGSIFQFSMVGLSLGFTFLLRGLCFISSLVMFDNRESFFELDELGTFIELSDEDEDLLCFPLRPPRWFLHSQHTSSVLACLSLLWLLYFSSPDIRNKDDRDCNNVQLLSVIFSFCSLSFPW